MKYRHVFLLALLALHLFLLLQLRFTAWPEMLFWPYLTFKGWLPYKDIGIAHSPLLVLVLGGYYQIAGFGIPQQQIFSWILTIITDLLLFFLTRKIFSLKIAIFSLFFFIWFQVSYDGNGVWFDHALTLFSILIFFSLANRKYFFSGLLWSLAFLTKQTAFWFLLPIFFAFITEKEKGKFIINIVSGALIVTAVLFWVLHQFQLQKDFLNWTFQFGIGKLPGLAGKLSDPRLFLSAIFPYLIFAPLFIRRKKGTLLLFVWSVSGALGAFPRFELFHFQPALPFLAVAFAKVVKRPSPLGLAFVGLIFILLGRGLIRSVHKPVRFFTSGDQKAISIVDDLTNPNDLIFITNYWDNLYSLTGTLPATRPFIPQLTQYVTTDIDSQLANDLITHPPKVVVRGKFGGTNDPFRFEKINNFIDNYYQTIETVGGVDILKSK